MSNLVRCVVMVAMEVYEDPKDYKNQSPEEIRKELQDAINEGSVTLDELIEHMDEDEDMFECVVGSDVRDLRDFTDDILGGDE